MKTVKITLKIKKRVKTVLDIMKLEIIKLSVKTNLEITTKTCLVFGYCLNTTYD